MLSPFGAIGVSLAVDVVRWRTLRRVARETGSDALAADALHFSSDLVSSLLVLVGLARRALGFAHADALAAIGVAAVHRHRRLSARPAHDRRAASTPRPRASPTRSATPSKRRPASPASIFCACAAAAPQMVGELGVFVSRTLPLERVAAIKSDARRGAGARWPTMALTITANPLALDDETVLERVQLIARAAALFVHHVDDPARRRARLRDARSRSRRPNDARRRARSREPARRRRSRPRSATTSRSRRISSRWRRANSAGQDADPELTRASRHARALRRKRRASARHPQRAPARRRGAAISASSTAGADRRRGSKPRIEEVDALERAAPRGISDRRAHRRPRRAG